MTGRLILSLAASTALRFALWAGMFGTDGEAVSSESLDLSTARIEADAGHEQERQDLVAHLTRIVGSEPDGTGELRIVVGTAPEGAETSPFTSYARRVGKVIYLWGDDLKTKRAVTTHHGTSSAVAGFLEVALGVRWVFPGEDGVVFKPQRRMVLPPDWQWSYCPLLAHMLIRTPGVELEREASNPYLPQTMRETDEEIRRRLDDRLAWMRHLRHQVRERPSFGHAFTGWSDRFIDSHPDYFALQEDGSRCAVRSPRHELCLSNPAVEDQIIADWRAAGCPRYLNVCPNDTRQYCRCPDCRRLDRPLSPDEPFARHVTDRYVNFWNRIAAKAIAIRPDVVLATYAYAGYREAPRVERIACPDHFIIGMVPSQEDDNAAQIAAWKQAGMRRFFLRPNYLCYRGVLVRGYERAFYENFQMNLRAGMSGCDFDAYPRGGVTDFESYVIGRVQTDPSLSFETLEGEFLSQFGPARDVMRRYFLRVRTRGEKALAQARAKPWKDAGKALDDSQRWETVIAAHPLEELEQDAAIVEEALSVPGLSPVERRRVLKYRYILRNAIGTLPFVKARDTLTRERYVSLALELIKLRIDLKPHLPDSWGRIFRSYPLEVRWWRAIKREVGAVYPEMELSD